MDYQTVLGEVGGWSIHDHIRLMHNLQDGLADLGHRAELTDELKAELDRRLAEHQENPGNAVPWEQIKAETLARLRK